jgi:hypothetical protein
MRLKEDYDGAEPAPASVAAANLVRLAALLPGGEAEGAAGVEGLGGAGGMGLGEGGYIERADRLLASAAGRLSGGMAAIAPQMCVAAWLRSRAPLRQVGGRWIAGERAGACCPL